MPAKSHACGARPRLASSQLVVPAAESQARPLAPRGGRRPAQNHSSVNLFSIDRTTNAGSLASNETHVPH